MMWSKSIISTEMRRFLLTGFINNGLGYLFFLVFVYVFQIGHKTSATILFVAGMLLNYFLNKNWTFGIQGSYVETIFKFSLTYLAGYFLNLGILSVFVDYFGYSAGLVQLLALGVLFVYYFTLNKYFIFKRST